MRDLCLLVLGVAVAVPCSWVLVGLANRIAHGSRHRWVNWMAGVSGAAAAAFAGLGPYAPFPIQQTGDYLPLLAVGLLTAGANAGILLSALTGWSYRKLKAIGLVDYLSRCKIGIFVGAVLGLLVGLVVTVALEMPVLDDLRQIGRSIMFTSLVLGGLLGLGFDATIRRRGYLASCVLGLLVILGYVVWGQVYLPLYPNLQFARTIGVADRLVVRQGGFDCCGRVDGQPVLCEVVDPVQIAEVRQHLQFVRRSPGPGCACCGYPGMDWYCGQTRVALTSVQHCKAIRWRGFHGDARLTEESSQWLKQWLNAHGITADSAYQP